MMTYRAHQMAVKWPRDNCIPDLKELMRQLTIPKSWIGYADNFRFQHKCVRLGEILRLAKAISRCSAGQWNKFVCVVSRYLARVMGHCSCRNGITWTWWVSSRYRASVMILPGVLTRLQCLPTSLRCPVHRNVVAPVRHHDKFPQCRDTYAAVTTV